MSVATATRHEFDSRNAALVGGPVRYVLEMEGRTFLAWCDEDSAVVIVTPIESWTIDELTDFVETLI
jgi:hypothetical protein